jgi:hypothetical protein
MDYKTMAIDFLNGNLAKGTIDSFDEKQIVEFVEVLFNQAKILTKGKMKPALINVLNELMEVQDVDFCFLIVQRLSANDFMRNRMVCLPEWITFSKKHRTYAINQNSFVKRDVRFGIPLTTYHDVQIAKELKLEYIDGFTRPIEDKENYWW